MPYSKTGKQYFSISSNFTTSQVYLHLLRIVLAEIKNCLLSSAKSTLNLTPPLSAIPRYLILLVHCIPAPFINIGGGASSLRGPIHIQLHFFRLKFIPISRPTSPQQSSIICNSNIEADNKIISSAYKRHPI